MVVLLLMVAGFLGGDFLGLGVLKHGIETGATKVLNVGVSPGDVELPGPGPETKKAKSSPRGSREKTSRGHTTDSLSQVALNLANHHAVMVDVREVSEWEAGHLSQAQRLSLSVLRQESRQGDFAGRMAARLPKDKIVYLHCRSGKRVLRAEKLLSELGYDIRPLQSGYDDLVGAGFEKTPGE